VSPREKHVPDEAGRTSVCLTIEDRAAIGWIRDTRKREKNNRTTNNDILVDALWSYLEEKYGRTREQIQASVPPPLPKQFSKIAQMPEPKKKR
jgi:hypothetical protein